MSCAPGRGVAITSAVICVLGLPGAAAARVGDLAPEFNGGQPVFVAPDAADPNASVTLGGVGGQRDHKVVAAGTMSSYGSRCAGCDEPVTWMIQRYLRDGRLDPGFGAGGVVKLTMEPMTFVSDLVVQRSDQRILIGGGSTHTRQLAFVRLNADGSLDTTFGGTGIVYLSRPDVSVGKVGTIALDRSGNAYLAASGADTSPCCTYRGLIASTTSDGAPNDWAPNGILVPETGAADYYNEEIASVAVAGGKVFYAGHSDPQPVFYNPPPLYGLLGAVRRADGAPATSFGSRGLVKLRDTQLRGLLHASDGKLKASGAVIDRAEALATPFIASFATTGADPRDRSFGQGGRAILKNGGLRLTEHRARLLFGELGAVETASGALDTRFGADGYRTVDFGTDAYMHAFASFGRFVAFAGNDNRRQGVVAVVEAVPRSGTLSVRISRRRLADGRLRIRLDGRVSLPENVTREDGCAGPIRARFRRDGRVVGRERVAVSPRCRYSLTETFASGRGPARVALRFAGNAFVGPSSVTKRL